MNFSVDPIKLRTLSLQLDFYNVPWDTEILGHPVAEIRHITITDALIAEHDFSEFREWLEKEKIQLCSCRVKHDQLVETDFLQKQNFRFMELNYHPKFTGLQDKDLKNQGIRVELAKDGDQDYLALMAGKIFKHGRYHQDLLVGSIIGNKRYRIWLENSFKNPQQVVYKCIENKAVVGFFVVEYSHKNSCHWSLIGLAPGISGRGMGARVWTAMLSFHQQEGMESISTSISSHNVAVFNLYIKLGFKFPIPDVTFHWHSN